MEPYLKGIVMGFSAIATVLLLYVFVFSKLMPGHDDPGDEISPEEM